MAFVESTRHVHGCELKVPAQVKEKSSVQADAHRVSRAALAI